MKRYCGRHFSADDLLAITGLIEQSPPLNRAELSRQICVKFNWLKPNGGLKDMTCRVAMLRMQADGLITLPPPLSRGRVSHRAAFIATATAATDAQSPMFRPVHDLAPLTLRQVVGNCPTIGNNVTVTAL